MFSCNLLSLGNYDIADKIGEPLLKGTAIATWAGIDRSDELGVHTSVR